MFITADMSPAIGLLADEIAAIDKKIAAQP
jgi:hypothetical protein